MIPALKYASVHAYLNGLVGEAIGNSESIGGWLPVASVLGVVAGATESISLRVLGEKTKHSDKISKVFSLCCGVFAAHYLKRALGIKDSKGQIITLLSSRVAFEILRKTPPLTFAIFSGALCHLFVEPLTKGRFICSKEGLRFGTIYGASEILSRYYFEKGARSLGLSNKKCKERYSSHASLVAKVASICFGAACAAGALKAIDGIKLSTKQIFVLTAISAAVELPHALRKH